MGRALIDTVIVSHQGPQIHYNICLQGIRFLKIGIQQTPLDQPLGANKQNKIAAGFVGDFPELIDANSGIGCRFSQMGTSCFILYSSRWDHLCIRHIYLSNLFLR
jgi:hypothetical protein